MAFLDQWRNRKLPELAFTSPIGASEVKPEVKSEAQSEVQPQAQSQKSVVQGESHMSFLSKLESVGSVLKVVEVAFNTVENAVGVGVAPVAAIVDVAASLAEAFPPTAPYAVAAVDITNEIETIVSALRGIKSKQVGATVTSGAAQGAANPSNISSQLAHS